MSPEMVVTAVGGILNLVNMILPLISKGSAGTTQISTIITTLTSVMPMVTDQIGTLYTGIKNIIASVGAHPATTEDQMLALKAFDKQVDEAWDAIQGQLDPDATA